MISPHTPPGTKVVCIEADALGVLQEGGLYTVSAITGYGVSRKGRQPFGVILWESVLPNGFAAFCPTRFRRADLPSCLTELLKPVNLPREEMV